MHTARKATERQKTTRWVLVAIGALALVAVGGGGGCEMWSPSRPQPVMLPDSEADAAVDRASQLAGQGFREQALAELEKAIAINPRLTTAYLGIGEIHKQDGNYEAAEKNFAKAADLEPRNFDAQYN